MGVRAALSPDASNASRRPQHVLASRSYRVVWRVVALAALLQTCYAAAFIWRTSFVVEAQRYFCLFDDAMISMRYASNWAHGDGLVWNPDERVEGYTNLAWTALMALCHLPGLSASSTCLLVQLLGIPVLWGCLVATALLARACRLLPVSAICAVCLVAAHYNLAFFSLFGMETGLLCLFVTLGLYECVKSVQRRQGHVRALLWFAPALLVRTDALLPACYAFVYLVLTVRRGRFRLLLGFLVTLAVVSAHSLWRVHYYGQWLPNSYYLKLTGWPLGARLGAGLEQGFWSAASLGIAFVLAIIPIVLSLTPLLSSKRWHLLLLGPFVLELAYQTYAGGDAWPLNRFLIPTTTGLFVLAAQGIQRILSTFVQRKTRPVGAAIRVGLTLLVILAVNGIHWDHWLLLTPPHTAADRHMNVRLWRAVERVAAPEASVAVAWAGTVPYFSHRRCCDLLGKCDCHIAHLPAHPGMNRAGHNKFDMAYTLSEHRPDIILHTYDLEEPLFRWEYHPITVEVDGEPVAFFVRNDSPCIHGGTETDVRTACSIMYRSSRGLEGSARALSARGGR